MAPSNQATNAAAKQTALVNFLYFLAPKTLLAREREKRMLSPKAKKKREAVNAIIYPFRPRPAPAPASGEPSVTEEVGAAPEGVKEKVKRVRFVLEEPTAADDEDEMEGSSPK